MAQKKITDLQLRTDFDETCNLPVDDTSQTWRTTGQQLTDFVVPFTAKGDLLVAGTSGIREVLPGYTTANTAILTQTGTGSASNVPAWRAFKPPTIQKFTSGSGTYTMPSSPAPLYIKVKMAGGGGGGAGSGTGTSGGAGVAGGNTTFGSSLLSANGGALGPNNSDGGVGGVASLGTGPIGLALQGGQGGGQDYTANAGVYSNGGHGGSTPYFSGGGAMPKAAGAGMAAVANTGGGGAGGSGQGLANQNSGGGGGSGGFVEAIIPNTSVAWNTTYAYAVGAGGAGGSAGTNGYVGGAGASGIIIVEEYYQ